jgi:hypothetical protein
MSAEGGLDDLVLLEDARRVVTAAAIRLRYIDRETHGGGPGVVQLRAFVAEPVPGSVKQRYKAATRMAEEKVNVAVYIILAAVSLLVSFLLFTTDLYRRLPIAMSSGQAKGVSLCFMGLGVFLLIRYLRNR